MADTPLPNLEPDQIPTKLGDSEIVEYHSEDGTTQRILGSIQILDQNGMVMDVWEKLFFSNEPDTEHLDTFTGPELSERSASHERLRSKAAAAWGLINEG